MFSTLRLQTRTKELCKSYGKDWGLVLVVLIAFSAIDQIEPFHRQFSVKDTTIQHPFAKKETVPDWLLGVKYTPYSIFRWFLFFMLLYGLIPLWQGGVGKKRNKANACLPFTPPSFFFV